MKVMREVILPYCGWKWNGSGTANSATSMRRYMTSGESLLVPVPTKLILLPSLSLTLMGDACCGSSLSGSLSVVAVERARPPPDMVLDAYDPPVESSCMTPQVSAAIVLPSTYANDTCAMSFFLLCDNVIIIARE